MTLRGRKHNTPAIDLEYRLAVTKVRASGVRTTVELSYGTKPIPARVTAAVQLEVRADARASALKTVRIPRAKSGELALDLALLEDGRLTSAGVAADPQKTALASAALTNALRGGAIGAFAGPAGAVAGAVIGGVVTVGTTLAPELMARQTKPRMGLANDDVPPTATVSSWPSELPEPAKVGVEPSYVEARPHEGDVLVRYRWAIGNLIERHAHLASLEPPADGFDRALRGLEKSIASCERVAQRSEDLYLRWLAEQRTETREVFEYELPIDRLPSRQELLDLINAKNPDELQKQSWWSLVENLHTIVTCDRVDDESWQTDDAPASSKQNICYRALQPSVVRTWRLVPDAKTGVGQPHLVEANFMLIARPGAERHIEVPVDASSKTGLDLSFAETGTLIGVGSTQTSQRAERISALNAAGSSAADAIGSGTAIRNTFSPTAIETTQKQGEFALRAARSKLAAPGKDPLGDLRADLERAELEARLAVAQHLITDPSQASTVVQDSPSA